MKPTQAQYYLNDSSAAIQLFQEFVDPNKMEALKFKIKLTFNSGKKNFKSSSTSNFLKLNTRFKMEHVNRHSYKEDNRETRKLNV